MSYASIQASQQLGKWSGQATYSISRFEVEFVPAPFDFLGSETELDEWAHSLALSLSRPISETLSMEWDFAGRDGFSNYRSVWLDTYFAQHFGPLEGVPGHELYQEVTPSALSATGGLRWQYLPASGMVTLSLTQVQEEVSPGYEIDFDGIRRSELVLATTAMSLVAENVLSPRLRSRLALTASDTSARQTRYSAEFALNAALAEKWVWRNTLGGSREDPQFDAYFFDTAVEYQVGERLSLYLKARRYRDTGEIENALLFSTAAPGLRNDSIGGGLRLVTENWSCHLSATHSRSDYEQRPGNTDFFQNLYRDDDWLSLQLAVSKAF
ncbi:hypothetical protein [Pelagicoccus sp. SDUM812003]|uniref:hypothetical protein n=1 Tax=Pelagicoccus sp. SDUM812003 TaxID=3041267 RepID=UPI00280F4E43|nr:hypothetical protein [Pelagicoccus sp. SDUM812003]MDQ8201903.1 hypothetical protein [Pelagicoccus sp. SDUM812003]